MVAAAAGMIVIVVRHGPQLVAQLLDERGVDAEGAFRLKGGAGM
jgi:hypothetical protein